ncbi:MAG TPA: hypothetical protein VF903_01800 [Nitrospirota bacterium]
MKKTIISGAVVLTIFAGLYYFFGMPRPVPVEKTEKIQSFLKTLIAETLEQDYHRHHINIAVLVTLVAIDRVEKKDHGEYLSYTVYGKAAYVIQGKRDWRDAEGNLIHLDPETEVTHWFSCEIYEDRYGELYKDKYRDNLVFYADNPLK